MFLIPWGNHFELGGGSVTERLRSTLAYGSVERCSDAAGCGRSFYKISNPVRFTSAILISVNKNGEHVERMLVGMYVVSIVYDK